MLQWQLFGIRFCIQPSFWLMNALWGYLLSGAVGGDRRGVLVFIIVWILCTLVSVMVHELGHVLMGRFFGQPGSITLAGLGGQALGSYEELNPWKRICVAFAGPGAGFIFLGVLVVFDSLWWNITMDWLDWQWLKLPACIIEQFDPAMTIRANRTYVIVMQLLFFMNLFWNLINLIPIIPMDGGMIFKDICIIIAPREGLKWAFAISFALASALTLYHLVVLLWLYHVLPLPFRPFHFAFPEFTFIMVAMMAYQSYIGLRQVMASQRHSMYRNYDD